LLIPHLDNLSSSGVFPIIVASIMILSMLQVLWKNRVKYSGFKMGEEVRQSVPRVFPKTVAIYAAILVLYILLLYPLHFWASSFLFLVASFVVLKGARIIQSLFFAAGLLVIVYFLFQYLFRVIFW
jgi:hypothetical protein